MHRILIFITFFACCFAGSALAETNAAEKAALVKELKALRWQVIRQHESCNDNVLVKRAYYKGAPLYLTSLKKEKKSRIGRAYPTCTATSINW